MPRKGRGGFIGPLLPNDVRMSRYKKKATLIGKKALGKVKKLLKAKHINVTGTGYRGAKIKGRGGYSISEIGENLITPFVDDTKSKGKVNKIARKIGQVAGSSFGFGDELGNATSWLSRAFGFGDYTIKKNSFQDYGNIAQFANHGTITFSHREYIMDISSTTSFQNTSFPINPGNSTLFPWLSTLARNFEQYEFLGLIFEFKSTSATAVGSVNTGLGTVIMATDYDVLDSPYSDKRAMEVAEFSTSAPPCASQIHPIECDPKQNVMKQLFIQPGNSVSTYPDDPRFSALGNFQIATSGMQATSTIGELWVSYHIKLLKPQLEESQSSSTTKLHVGLTTASGGTPSINFFDTSNPGSITGAIASGKYVLTCATAAGIGKYLLAHCYRDSTSTGTLVSTGIAVKDPVCAQNATFVTLAYTNGGIPDAQAAVFSACGVNNGANVSLQDYNPTSQVCVFEFMSVGDTIALPLYYNSAAGVYHDVYVAPYTTSFVSGYQQKSGKDEIVKNDVLELKKQMAQFMDTQAKLKKEFTEIRQELDEHEDNGYEVTVDSSDVARLVDRLSSVNLIKNSPSEIDECLRQTVEMLGRNLTLSDRIRLEHFYTNLKKYHL